MKVNTHRGLVKPTGPVLWCGDDDDDDDDVLSGSTAAALGLHTAGTC